MLSSACCENIFLQGAAKHNKSKRKQARKKVIKNGISACTMDDKSPLSHVFTEDSDAVLSYIK